MARAFVAVVPPGEVLDAVDEALSRVRAKVPGARWSRREQWHLTLQFLGNKADLDPVAQGLAALAVGRGEVRLGGGGAFPGERRARVLWLGLVEGAPLIAQVAAATGALLAPLGYDPEDRPFHPHLTLARLKVPGDLREAVDALGADPVGPSWTAGEVVLFESTQDRDGPRYRAYASFPLR